MTAVFKIHGNSSSVDRLSVDRLSVYRLWVVLAAAIVSLLINPGALAQETNPALDTTPPIVELETLDLVLADRSQVFTVQIAEETELQDVTLFHRRSGQLPYTAAPMSPIGISGFYSASISTDPTDLRPIEYYVQARDTSANRTVSGFAFDPHVRKLSAPLVAQAPSDPVAPEQPTPVAEPIATNPQPFYKKRWVQVALGVVAVGFIASSLDSEEGTNTQFATVNLTLE